MADKKPIEQKLKKEYTSSPTGVKGLKQFVKSVGEILSDNNMSSQFEKKELEQLEELKQLGEKIFTSDRTYVNSIVTPGAINAFVNNSNLKSCAEKFKSVQEIKKDNLQQLANDFAEMYAQGRPQDDMLAHKFYAWCVLSACFLNTVIYKMDQIGCPNILKYLGLQRDAFLKVVKLINKSVASCVSGNWIPLSISAIIPKTTLIFPSKEFINKRHEELFESNGYTNQPQGTNFVNGYQQNQGYQNYNYAQNTVSYNNNNQNQVPQQQFQNQNAYAQQAPQSPAASYPQTGLNGNQSPVQQPAQMNQQQVQLNPQQPVDANVAQQGATQFNSSEMSLLNNVITQCLDTWGGIQLEVVASGFKGDIDLKKGLRRFIRALPPKSKAYLQELIRRLCLQYKLTGRETALYNGLIGYLLESISADKLIGLISNDLMMKINQFNSGQLSPSRYQTLDQEDIESFGGIEKGKLQKLLTSLFAQFMDMTDTRRIRPRVNAGDWKWFRQQFLSFLLTLYDSDLQEVHYKAAGYKIDINSAPGRLEKFKRYLATVAEGFQDNWYSEKAAMYLERQNRSHFKGGNNGGMDAPLYNTNDKYLNPALGDSATASQYPMGANNQYQNNQTQNPQATVYGQTQTQPAATNRPHVKFQLPDDQTSGYQTTGYQTAANTGATANQAPANQTTANTDAASNPNHASVGTQTGVGVQNQGITGNLNAADGGQTGQKPILKVTGANPTDDTGPEPPVSGYGTYSALQIAIIDEIANEMHVSLKSGTTTVGDLIKAFEKFGLTQSNKIV